MFDIGWSELLVIAVVAVIVVGPKELPRMLRTFGKTMGTVRRTANDFKRQFDQALREAEREADLEDTRKQLQSIGHIDPVGAAKKDIEASFRAGNVASSPAPDPQAASQEPRATEPLKTGAAAPQAGSDAA
jgi:sec-independent protein translocase protein TatB